MANLAIFVIGNFEKMKENFFKEVKVMLNDQEKSFSNIQICMIDGKASSECVDETRKSLNIKSSLIKVVQHSPSAFVFEAKHFLDIHNSTQCWFIVNEENKEAIKSACDILFPPVYNVFINVSKNLSEEIFENQDLTAVAEYLHTLSSTGGKPVAVFQSKLFTNQFVHGYSGRQGGISTHPGLSSLNMCYSLKKRDARVVVLENRARLAAAAGFDSKRLFLAKAVHGKDVWVYEEKEPESYDAIISKTPGVVVAAPGADCNMLLFADPVTGSCGAAHAGWKGLLCGVVEATVNKMVESYGSNPKDLIVSIGPSLSVCCCEFGIAESEKFLAIDKEIVVWKEKSEKPFLDLRLAAKVLLLKSGILLTNIDDGKESDSSLDACTKCDPENRFYSFRRIGTQFGNQVGFIGCLKL